MVHAAVGLAFAAMPPPRLATAPSPPVAPVTPQPIVDVIPNAAPIEARDFKPEPPPPRPQRPG
jgi:hypothetical protein